MKICAPYRLILLSLLVLLGISACSPKDESLSLYREVYEAQLNREQYIGIKSGNGKYDFLVEDPSLLEVKMASDDMISVYGKKKGETTLLIRDVTTKEMAEVKVKVTDNYIVYRSQLIENRHPLLNQENFIFLINNEAQDAYFYKREEVGYTDYRLTLIGKGSYGFLANGDELFFKLTYRSDENGKWTPTDEPKAHRFVVTQCDPIFEVVEGELKLNWSNLLHARMTLKSSEGNCTVEGQFSYHDLPLGDLK